MPPRRRTFYLADATALSNAKVRRLQRDPRWLAAWGAFHILIGVATLEDDPTFTEEDCGDFLGPDAHDLVLMLRTVGLMDETGLDAATFDEWKPKARPRYPSDGLPRSQTDSGGVQPDSDVIPSDSRGMPTSSTSSTTTTASSSSSRGNGEWDAKVAASLARSRS